MTSISASPPRRLWEYLVTVIREDFTGPISADLVWAFRAYIGFHMFTRSLDLYLTSAPDWLILAIQATTLGAAFVTLHRRYYWVGIGVLLLFQMMMLPLDFPNTANHYFVEFYLLLVLFLCPNRRDPETGQIRDGTCYYLIQLLFLSIYFYAGIHKALYGFWFNGEFIADTLHNPKGYGLPATFQILLPPIAGFFGLPLNDILTIPTTEIERVTLQTPSWFIGLALTFGWSTVISEIIIPPLVLFRQTRRFGVWLMFLLTTAIGIMSWEIEFLFVAWGCMLLFFPEKPIRNYAIFLAVHLLWSIGVYWLDIPIWVL